MSTPVRTLFGTDGVRGEVGTLLTTELAADLGRAAVNSLEQSRPQVVIVRDTRESGPMLEAALASGIAEAGGEALLAGVLPTPAAAVLVRRLGLDLAAVVSASHNPYRDNGIKFFDRSGTKLDDDAEARVEGALGDRTASPEPGHIRELRGGAEDYLRTLQTAFPLDLEGRVVALDCANGATHRVAPEIFERLGATVETIAVEPDGRNINADCGSTHLQPLSEHVAGSDASIGFAFDGDGDRVLAVDGGGRPHDGDELIALIARGAARRGELEGGVAVTVMSNYGLHRVLQEEGIEVAVTDVGDRYVLDELARRNWRLGGEQSGHIIDTGFAATGDGIAAALMTLRELGDGDLAAAEAMEKLPQLLLNVRVADREGLRGAEGVWGAVQRESAALEGRGRVLLRPSGTEPVIRVMVEAPAHDEAQAVAERLADVVRAELS
jgi:phosphoglucosamine mutase